MSKQVQMSDIVIYHFPVNVQSGGKSKVAPAIVTSVNADGTANLTVFNDGLSNDYVKNVAYGPDGWGWLEDELKPTATSAVK